MTRAKYILCSKWYCDECRMITFYKTPLPLMSGKATFKAKLSLTPKKKKNYLHFGKKNPIKSKQ